MYLPVLRQEDQTRRPLTANQVLLVPLQARAMHLQLVRLECQLAELSAANLCFLLLLEARLMYPLVEQLEFRPQAAYRYFQVIRLVFQPVRPLAAANLALLLVLALQLVLEESATRAPQTATRRVLVRSLAQQPSHEAVERLAHRERVLVVDDAATVEERPDVAMLRHSTALDPRLNLANDLLSCGSCLELLDAWELAPYDSCAKPLDP
jgi:hypothetical protein